MSPTKARDLKLNSIFKYLGLKYALATNSQILRLGNVKLKIVNRTAKYLFKEIFLKQTYFFESKTARPLIFDCGANIGFATVYFKELYPESQVIAFEANQETFSFLQENITKNNYTGVQLERVALTDHDGTVKFYYDKKNVADLGMSLDQRYFKDYDEVPAKKISGYINGVVDLVKLDIEGAEHKVLDELIASKKIGLIRQFIIEYHHSVEKGDGHIGRFISKLEDCGFKCNISTETFKNFRSTEEQAFMIYAFNSNVESHFLSNS